MKNVPGVNKILLMVKRVLIIIFAVALGGCNYFLGEEGMFRDRGSDYLEAQALAQMEIPENLDSYTLFRSKSLRLPFLSKKYRCQNRSRADGGKGS